MNEQKPFSRNPAGRPRKYERHSETATNYANQVARGYVAVQCTLNVEFAEMIAQIARSQRRSRSTYIAALIEDDLIRRGIIREDQRDIFV